MRVRARPLPFIPVTFILLHIVFYFLSRVKFVVDTQLGGSVGSGLGSGVVGGGGPAPQPTAQTSLRGVVPSSLARSSERSATSIHVRILFGAQRASRFD